jgi:hypothetical protein
MFDHIYDDFIKQIICEVDLMPYWCELPDASGVSNRMRVSIHHRRNDDCVDSEMFGELLALWITVNSAKGTIRLQLFRGEEDVSLVTPVCTAYSIDNTQGIEINFNEAVKFHDFKTTLKQVLRGL